MKMHPVLAAVAAMTLALSTAVANGLKTVIQIKIGPQPVSAALLEFSDQTKLQVVSVGAEVRGLRSPGVQGQWALEEALVQLLAGTGLEFELISDKTVRIFAGSGGQAAAWKGEDGLRLAYGSSPNDGEAAASGSDQGQTNTRATQQAKPSDEATDSNGDKIQEIIVTAQKRAENIQDVPMSIGVVTAEDIGRRGLVSGEDFLRGIPGVGQTSSGAYGQAIVIRGLDTARQSQNLFSGTTVATYFGETPTTSTGAIVNAGNTDIKLVDIERVEVLRGPQGTAFGSSSIGGAVRTIPVAPKVDRFEGKVAAGYSVTSGTGGDNNLIQGVVNLPLFHDRLALRAVGYRFEESGYYQNRAGSDASFRARSVTPYAAEAYAIDEDETGGSRFTGGRLAALLQASDDLKITLSYLSQKTETDGLPLQTSAQPYVQTLLQVAPEDAHRGQSGSIADTDLAITNAVVEYDLGWANLLGTYSYVTSESIPVWAFTSLGDTRPWSSGGFGEQIARSGELRLTTNLEGPWNFLGGLYAENIDEDAHYDYYWHGSPDTNVFRFLPLFAGDFLGFDRYRRNLKQQAAFAQVSWEFLPRLTLTAGARYYDYERTERRQTTGAIVGVTDVDRSSNASGSVFRGNLAYELNDDALVYAGWSQGFRLGRPQPGIPAALCDLNNDGIVDGANITIASTQQISSDTVDNYELGAKFTALDRRLTISTAVYRIDWNDMPARNEVLAAPTCFSGGVAYNANFGSARSEGIEVEATFYVTPALRVDIGGSKLRARLADEAPPLELNVPRGARLLAPEVNGSVGLQYEFEIAGYKSFARADSTYVGAVYGNIQNTPNSKTDSYTTLDVSAGTDLKSLRINLYARNLLNADDYTYLGRAQVPYPDYPGYGYRLRPRTIGLQLSYGF